MALCGTILVAVLSLQRWCLTMMLFVNRRGALQ
jgi:hypothetical protein